MILGTDIHPFDRMCRWADAWCSRNPGDDLLVQRGYTDAPKIARSVMMFTPSELAQALDTADIAISHGGPGTISAVRAAGLLPIVLPRNPAHGEHVDDHQLRFAAWAGERGLAHVVDDVSELGKAIQTAGTTRPSSESPHAQIEASVIALRSAIAEAERGNRFRWSLPRFARNTRRTQKADR